MKEYLGMRLISLLTIPTVATYALLKGTPDSMMEYVAIFTVIVFILTGLLMYNLIELFLHNGDIEKFIKYNRQSIGWLNVLRGLVGAYAIVVCLYLAIYTDGMIMPLLYSIAIYIVVLYLATICIAIYIKRIFKNLSVTNK